MTDQKPSARLHSFLWGVGLSSLAITPSSVDLLTVWIRWVQPQPLQGVCARMQEEPHALHPEKSHVTKTKSPKKGNHVLHELLLCETRERQPPTKRGYGEGSEVHVSRALLCVHRSVVAELEVLEVWEEPDEIDDLAGRAYGFPESEESEGRCEVSKVPLNVWHEAGHLELVYPKLLEVCEGGKVTQGPPVELFGSEGTIECADTESLDKRKQVEIV